MAIINDVIEEIKKKLNDNTLEVTQHNVLKNNGVVLHGIVIKKPGCNVCSTIYIDTYLKNNNAPELIADQVIKSYLAGTKHPERCFKKGPFHAASFIINSMLFGPAIFVMILINQRRDDAGL
jgi:hypothetical protein